jgi:hypothetical protein
VPNLFESFRGMVAALSEASVPFAVCGGLAMSIHARPRATIDIDLLAPTDAIEHLVEALRPIGFVRREQSPTRLAEGRIVMHRLTQVLPGDLDVLILDIIEVGSGITAEAWAGREMADWEGHRLPVVSREGLIALKRLRNSAQDQADIQALERG